MPPRNNGAGDMRPGNWVLPAGILLVGYAAMVYHGRYQMHRDMQGYGEPHDAPNIDRGALGSTVEWEDLGLNEHLTSNDNQPATTAASVEDQDVFVDINHGATTTMPPTSTTSSDEMPSSYLKAAALARGIPQRQIISAIFILMVVLGSLKSLFSGWMGWPEGQTLDAGGVMEASASPKPETQTQPDLVQSLRARIAELEEARVVDHRRIDAFRREVDDAREAREMETEQAVRDRVWPLEDKLSKEKMCARSAQKALEARVTVADEQVATSLRRVSELETRVEEQERRINELEGQRAADRDEIATTESMLADEMNQNMQHRQRIASLEEQLAEWEQYYHNNGQYEGEEGDYEGDHPDGEYNEEEYHETDGEGNGQDEGADPEYDQVAAHEAWLLDMIPRWFEDLEIPSAELDTLTKSSLNKYHRKFMLRHHPDKNINDPSGAHERTIAAQNAYTELSKYMFNDDQDRSSGLQDTDAPFTST
ncbi:hypothetical protein K490DRAFT_58882 [Saccharata proteae CBS 121410]|uniref:J domain-containing protein n=1 Tax=Saccharata proteae CBS 121410 TaxID=1314787 RepID=A0A9P4HP37_9PEZI|nr:hypothetical protein K490DRAFT_58882 [Saccharata proteae CBS 121410]